MERPWNQELSIPPTTTLQFHTTTQQDRRGEWQVVFAHNTNRMLLLHTYTPSTTGTEKPDITTAQGSTSSPQHSSDLTSPQTTLHETTFVWTQEPIGSSNSNSGSQHSEVASGIGTGAIAGRFSGYMNLVKIGLQQSHV